MANQGNNRGNDQTQGDNQGQGNRGQGNQGQGKQGHGNDQNREWTSNVSVRSPPRAVARRSSLAPHTS